MATFKELDDLYLKVDDLMHRKKLEELDLMFVFPEEGDHGDLDLMIGLLVASLPVKSKLPRRTTYFNRLEELCKERGEHPTLLSGLK